MCIRDRYQRRVREKFFPESKPEIQGPRLYSSLNFMIKNASDVDTLNQYCFNMGERHKKYKIAAEHFDVVGDTFIRTLHDFLGDEFTPEIKQQFELLYKIVADMTIKGLENPSSETKPTDPGK
eukprot:TRINITY_DN6078_c0_g1_i1.p1 TRINITY_DN6078_c0_g1~~TRINITY_DN6078_c0_g1_i1.p1  ORF type:complete len:123 (+),score=34.49 TRINITY_DN6078_c0_g1_i1:28-396(+)